MSLNHSTTKNMTSIICVRRAVALERDTCNEHRGGGGANGAVGAQSRTSHPSGVFLKQDELMTFQFMPMSLSYFNGLMMLW
mmetsp:Transcript_43113/g.52302  ORF Transcript_43113/g.52302 Transcript_43113/m.52302 type:complete len:81 (-) Transcript_43113:45-287(-)